MAENKQEKSSPANRTIPSWQDCAVSLGTEQEVEYNVTKNDGVTSTSIYNGKAYKKPSASENIVVLNDIVRENLDRPFPKFDGLYEYFDHGDNPIYIVRAKSAPTPIDEVRVVYDWTYREGVPYSPFISDPITGEVDPRQPLIVSKNAPAVLFNATIKNGDGTGDFIVPWVTAEYPNDREIGSGVVHLSSFPEATSVTALLRSRNTNWRLEYKVVKSCARYVLYYINKRGGWDWLIIKGTGVESDNYDRKMYEKPYNESNLSERGRTIYLNDITKTYDLHTGFLTSAQSERMDEVIGTPNAVLYDLETNEVQPVNINDKRCRKTNYKNNGAQLVDWEIAVTISQNRYRK